METGQTSSEVGVEQELNVVVKDEEISAQDVAVVEAAHASNSGNLNFQNEAEIDVIVDDEFDTPDCSSSCKAGWMAKYEDPDATEHSSSFGDTFSDPNGSLMTEQNDIEVDSPLFPLREESLAPSSCNTRFFKKRKVTPHWRKFVSPLAWRCQWLELRMKELQLQVSRYDRELAMLKQEKSLQSKMIELDSSAARTVPFSIRSRQAKAMRRRKRRRTEETADDSVYMSNHLIFSYAENRRAETDGHSLDDINSDFADENSRGGDDIEWLQGSGVFLEHILSKIQAVQSRSLSLRSMLTRAMTRRRKREGPSGAARNRAMSYGHAQYHPSECETEEASLVGSATSSYGEATDVDIMTSTIGLLSAADVPGQVGEMCTENSDDILIDNRIVKHEYENFEKVGVQTDQLLLQEPQLPSEAREAGSFSDGESAAPEITDLSATRETEKVALKVYTGKRRGRKPKRRHRGGSAAVPTACSASESSVGRLGGPLATLRRGSGSSTSMTWNRRGSISAASSSRRGRGRSAASRGSSASASALHCWRSERIRKRKLLEKQT